MKKFAHKVAYIAGGIIIGIVFRQPQGRLRIRSNRLLGKRLQENIQL